MNHLKTLGKCPVCKNGNIQIQKKEVQGKKVELYACSNASWTTLDEGEMFELTKESTCSFKIWQNALGRYGYWLKHKDVRALLNKEDTIVEQSSKKIRFENNKKSFKKIKYKKYITLDLEYGVSVLFELEVEEEKDEYPA